MVSIILKSLMSAGATWLQARSRERYALSRARTKSILRSAKSEQNWRSIMAVGSHTSWKDELWTVSFIIIIFLCFVPQSQQSIANGFEVLKATPEWFQWSMLLSISASFGVRGFDKFFKNKSY